MTLAEHVKQCGRGELSRLQRASGLAYSTVYYAHQGRAMRSYLKAAQLSQATGGAVTIDELCGGAPQKKRGAR